MEELTNSTAGVIRSHVSSSRLTIHHSPLKATSAPVLRDTASVFAKI